MKVTEAIETKSSAESGLDVDVVVLVQSSLVPSKYPCLTDPEEGSARAAVDLLTSSADFAFNFKNGQTEDRRTSNGASQICNETDCGFHKYGRYDRYDRDHRHGT